MVVSVLWIVDVTVDKKQHWINILDKNIDTFKDMLTFFRGFFFSYLENKCFLGAFLFQAAFKLTF